MKKLLLSLAISSVLVGCGGSDSNDAPVEPPVAIVPDCEELENCNVSVEPIDVIIAPIPHDGNCASNNTCDVYLEPIDVIIDPIKMPIEVEPIDVVISPIDSDHLCYGYTLKQMTPSTTQYRRFDSCTQDIKDMGEVRNDFIPLDMDSINQFIMLKDSNHKVISVEGWVYDTDWNRVTHYDVDFSDPSVAYFGRSYFTDVDGGKIEVSFGDWEFLSKLEVNVDKTGLDGVKESVLKCTLDSLADNYTCTYGGIEYPMNSDSYVERPKFDGLSDYAMILENYLMKYNSLR